MEGGGDHSKGEVSVCVFLHFRGSRNPASGIALLIPKFMAINDHAPFWFFFLNTSPTTSISVCLCQGKSNSVFTFTACSATLWPTDKLAKPAIREPSLLSPSESYH